ncbi:MAG TPA: hypothetical protein VLG50_05640 [Candidatus Saccharimonadales bacterium]|nr:hypothetical protein [Candidatus Saccharimonadales bacterium]
MTTCKGLIYNTSKSRLPPTPCTNKAKDNNGFCGIHKKQSSDYIYKVNIVQFKIIYQGCECAIKMRRNDPIGKVLFHVNERFGLVGHVLSYQGEFIDLTLPAYLFDGVTLSLDKLCG